MEDIRSQVTCQKFVTLHIKITNSKHQNSNNTKNQNSNALNQKKCLIIFEILKLGFRICLWFDAWDLDFFKTEFLRSYLCPPAKLVDPYYTPQVEQY